MPYDGNPEIKERADNKYLYTRKRIAGKLTSTYVDIYLDELHQLLLRHARGGRELNKNIRHTNKKLASLGYEGRELPGRIVENMDFAGVNMKSNIYDQAVLEGMATSFPQTKEIIENGIVNGVSATDVQKILSLKHAWEFILDQDVLRSKTNHYLIAHGMGFLVIPDKEVPTFKKLLIDFYEGEDMVVICDFMKESCWRIF